MKKTDEEKKQARADAQKRYREKNRADINKRSREQRRKRWKEDREWRKKQRAKAAAYYRKDPVKREERIRKAKERYWENREEILHEKWKRYYW